MTLQPLDLFDTLGDPWLPLSLALVGVGESGDPNVEWIFSEMVGLWICSLFKYQNDVAYRSICNIQTCACAWVFGKLHQNERFGSMSFLFQRDFRRESPGGYHRIAAWKDIFADFRL